MASTEVKLTPQQKVLIDHMKDGWALGHDQVLIKFGQKGRMDAPAIHRRTIAGLQTRGFLDYEFHSRRYALTETGKSL